jgi:hypothetical protein
LDEAGESFLQDAVLRRRLQEKSDESHYICEEILK